MKRYNLSLLTRSIDLKGRRPSVLSLADMNEFAFKSKFYGSQDF